METRHLLPLKQRRVFLERKNVNLPKQYVEVLYSA